MPLLRNALLCLVAIAAVPARAQSISPIEPLEIVAEATLDIDGDGRPDRAVLLRAGLKSWLSELRIYLDAGDGPLDLTRKPAISRIDFADDAVQRLEARGKGDGKGRQSLFVAFGCGGCTNDVERAFTIVHRNGTFLIAGFSLDWDARYGSGHCDINFLTGLGVASKGPGTREHPVTGNFKPVKLSAWTEEFEPHKACGF